MNPQLISAFHDGEIIRVSGRVGEDIEITVSADYLSRQLVQSEDYFIIRLLRCRRWLFESFENGGRSQIPNEISDKGFEILGAELDHDKSATKILTTGGTIWVCYEDQQVSLGCIANVALNDLHAASDRAVAMERERQ